MRARTEGGGRLKSNRHVVGPADGHRLVERPIPALVLESTKVAPGLFSGGVVAAVLAGLVPVANAIASGRLVEAALAVIGGDGSTPVEAYKWLVVLALGFLGSQALLAFRSYLGEAAGRRVTGSALERAILALARPATVDHLDDPRVRAAAAQVRGIGSIEVLPGDGTASLVNKLSAWAGNLAAAAVLARLAWWIGVGGFVLLGASYVAILRNYRSIVVASRDEEGLLRRAAYLRDVVITADAAKEVRVFGLGELFTSRFAKASEDTRRDFGPARGVRAEWLSVAMSLFIAVVYLAVFGVLGSRAARGGLSVGDLATAALAIGSLTNGILPGRDDLNVAWGAASLSAVRALEAELSGQEASDPWSAQDLPTEVVCHEVTYGYPDGTLVFDGFDLTLRAGESLAIVGENGAGKTTLARLLAGLTFAQAGGISVDGALLDGRSLGGWQRNVAVLFQDFVRYHATLRDNVVFGAPEHADDDAGFLEVCRHAGLDDLVSGLALGADTLLSSAYEGGVDLSGGQWQRVALARALFSLRHGARLLILDEPAASLDVTAEADLYDRFLELTRGITSVLVSHRLAAVRHANRIVVIEGGRVVEDGDHDSLVGSGGRYAEMFSMQARRFNEGGAS